MNCNSSEEKEAEVASASHAAGVFRTILKTDHAAMKQAYEVVLGEKLPRPSVLLKL